MSEFQEFLNEQLQDDEFRKEWEDIQPEMDVIWVMVECKDITKSYSKRTCRKGRNQSGRYKQTGKRNEESLS